MEAVRLSYTSALVLRAISVGLKYGFDIMDATGLPSGTVYPTLRRLEQQELIRSSWEPEQEAHVEERPARKYYKLTAEGKETLHKAMGRFALLEELGIEKQHER